MRILYSLLWHILFLGHPSQMPLPQKLCGQEKSDPLYVTRAMCVPWRDSSFCWLTASHSASSLEGICDKYKTGFLSSRSLKFHWKTVYQMCLSSCPDWMWFCAREWNRPKAPWDLRLICAYSVASVMSNFLRPWTPVLWPPDTKSWLIGKDPDAGKDWGREEKGTTEDKMVGWHHWLNGHGFGWTPGDGDGQGGLVCCDSWGRKESDTTEQLNWMDYRVLDRLLCPRDSPGKNAGLGYHAPLQGIFLI